MDRGFTLVEMLIALGVASVAAAGASFFFSFADAESRTLQAQADALNSSQQIATNFQKWFLTKPSGGHAECSKVVGGKNAYCLDACTTGQSECKIAGISSAIGPDPRVAFFSTSCEAVTGKFANLTFPPFCGMACEVGKRPVTTYRVVGRGRDVTKKHPSSDKSDSHAGSALCLTRDAAASTLQLSVATFTRSSGEEILLRQQTYVFPESTFDVPGVYFVND